MTTQKQIAANQRNALKSTGPRSLAGISRSRMNAVRHGLTANQGLLPGEDAKEFDVVRRGAFNELRPVGVVENQLVERVASLIWRMRRIQIFEAALMEFTAFYQANMWDSADHEFRLVNDPDSIKPMDDLEDSLKLGRVIETLLSSDMTGKLTRYETAMQRQLGATLHELRELAKFRPPLPKIDPNAPQAIFVKPPYTRKSIERALQEHFKKTGQQGRHGP